ncbi:MAG: DNA-directed RNA polymerase II subunit RPB1 [Bogoriella megaspora]|nr:MAG: DNA-directed RNA polymerase II subunit RPB1 [Bogoriella megaspora]
MDSGSFPFPSGHTAVKDLRAVSDHMKSKYNWCFNEAYFNGLAEQDVEIATFKARLGLICLLRMAQGREGNDGTLRRAVDDATQKIIDVHESELQDKRQLTKELEKMNQELHQKEKQLRILQHERQDTTPSKPKYIDSATQTTPSKPKYIDSATQTTPSKPEYVDAATQTTPSKPEYVDAATQTTPSKPEYTDASTQTSIFDNSSPFQNGLRKAIDEIGQQVSALQMMHQQTKDDLTKARHEINRLKDRLISEARKHDNIANDTQGNNVKSLKKSPTDSKELKNGPTIRKEPHAEVTKDPRTTVAQKIGARHLIGGVVLALLVWWMVH